MKTHQNHDLKFTIYRRIAVSFVALTTALLGVIIYFSIGKAVISIVPTPRATKVELAIPIRPGMPATPGDAVLAGAIESVDVEVSETVIAAAAREIPAKARGLVTLINISDRAQTLVATTRLFTPENVLFRIQKNVTVPARGRVSVEAVADKPGREGEIVPTTFTIPGLPSYRQREVYAENTEAMTGGVTTDLAITDDDIAEAKKKIDEKLKAAAIEKLDASAGAGSFLPYSLTLASQAETREDFTGTESGAPQVGAVIHVRASATAARFDERQLFDLLRDGISRTVPQFHAVHQLDYTTLSVTTTEHNPDGSGVIRAAITAWSILDVKTPALNPERFISVTPADIRTALAELPDIKEINIRLFPLWARRTPQLKENIEVRMEEPTIPQS